MIPCGGPVSRNASLSPRSYFAAESLVSVLHPRLNHGPALGLPALLFDARLIAQRGQIGNASFAGEKAACGEIAEPAEPQYPVTIRGGGTRRPGNPIQDLLLLRGRGAGEIAVEQSRG